MALVEWTRLCLRRYRDDNFVLAPGISLKRIGDLITVVPRRDRAREREGVEEDCDVDRRRRGGDGASSGLGERRAGVAFGAINGPVRVHLERRVHRPIVVVRGGPAT